MISIGYCSAVYLHSADSGRSDRGAAHPVFRREKIAALMESAGIRLAVVDFFCHDGCSRQSQGIHGIPEVIRILLLIIIIEIGHSEPGEPAFQVLVVHDLAVADAAGIHTDAEQIISGPVYGAVHVRIYLVHRCFG